VCFCGVLPSINRAWATVDNALFLWRLDRPDDVPVEYSGEEQAIVAVGLAKPKRGVFLKTIDAVLVVATTVEVVLVGCAFGDGAEGTTYDDPLTLHPLNYSCTTDDVVAKDIASTEDGRIFFAGDDESLYEIEYSATDTWRQRRCRKVCHHSALPRMLPSILRLRAPDPLRQVLVDEHRCALYTRSEAGVVMVFDLGPRCADAPRKVAEVRDVAAASQMARGGGGLFNQYGGYGGGYGGGSSSGYGVGGGGYGGGGSYGAQSNAAAKDGQSQAQKGRRLAHISVVSSSESSVVTLVAVCADGRRVYFTTLPAEGRALGYVGSQNGYASQNQVGSVGGSMNKERRVVPPACRLAVVQSREPLPQGSAQRGMSSAQALRATTTVRPLEVEAAFYGDGLMLLCDATERDEDARLFMASRDLALPPHMQLDANAGLVGSPGINPGSGINPNLNPAPTNNPYGTPGNNPYGTPGRSTGVVPGQMGSPGINPQSSGAYQGVGAGAQSGAAIRSLREIVTPQPLQGRAASAVGSVGEIPPPIGVQRDLDPPYPVGAPRELTTQPRPLRSELATQHLGAPRRKFVVVTNAGIVTVEKSRPLDALSKILVSDAPEPLVNFFKSYGQAEAATMCLAIAVGASESGGGGSKNSISSIEGGPNDGSRLTPGGGVGTPGTPGGHAVFGASGSPRVPPSVIGTPQGAFGAAGGYQPSYGAANLADRARRALEDPRLTGEPRVDEDLNAFGVDAGAGGQFDMGRAIVQPQLHYSGVHRAVYTYAARLLAPTWERPLWVPINVANEHGVGAGTSGAKTYGQDPHARAKTHGGGGGIHGVNPSGIHPSSKPLRDVINAGAADGGGVTGAAAAAAGWLGGILRPNHPTGAPVACTIPPDVLASLERRLAPLENFLARRRPRVAPSDRSRTGGPNFGMSPPARQRRRLDGPADALRAEERSIAALRGLVRRTREACALLRVVAEEDFGNRCVGWLAPETRASLQRLTLRGFATTGEGAHVASSLIEALMGQRTRVDLTGVDALASRLQDAAPLFFDGAARTFYRARELLQAARDARDGRDHQTCAETVARSLEMLLGVPLAGDPTAVMAELADLRCFHGLVALPLAAAAAAAESAVAGDGVGSLGVGAAQPSAASAASPKPAFGQGRQIGANGADGSLGRTNAAPDAEECFEYVCVAIRALASGVADPGSPPGSLGAVCAGLSADERAHGLAVLLERCAQASSPAAAAAATAAAKAAAANAAAAAAAAAASPRAPGAIPPLRPPSPSITATAAATRVEVTGASVTGDGAFIRRVYAELIQLGRDEDLLELPAGPLEAHLAERGKFATAQQGGALTRDQSRHLELLARLYARRDRHGLAAQVFFALAERTGSADSTVSLDERAALLDLATRHAKTPGGNAANSSDQTNESDVDPAFVEQIEGKIKVLGFQRRLHATFTERSRDGLSADADRYASKASELERELRPLSDMYNDFAFPCDMWDVCLEMLHFSQYRDADGGVARGLWDSLLAGEGSAAVAAGGDDRAALSAACNAARALGPKLFPSDVAFPVAHVALKLELMAGGLWGGTRSAVSGSEEVGAVAEALLAATGDSPEAVHAAYDGLLATPASRAQHGQLLVQAEQLQTPALRLRLLRSALRVLRRWDEKIRAAQVRNGGVDGGGGGGGFGAFGAAGAHVRAALGDVCVGYAGEARRLLQVPTSAQGAAESLAEEFDALGKRLIG
jgi:nuclear pore complex protein Nup155